MPKVVGLGGTGFVPDKMEKIQRVVRVSYTGAEEGE